MFAGLVFTGKIFNIRKGTIPVIGVRYNPVGKVTSIGKYPGTAIPRVIAPVFVFLKVETYYRL